MTTDDIISLMRERANATMRERERIIKFIQILEDTYRSNGNLDCASVCQSIIYEIKEPYHGL